MYGEELYEFGNALVVGFVSADEVLASAVGRSGTAGGAEGAAAAGVGVDAVLVFVATGGEGAAAAAAVPRSHGFGGEGILVI